MEYLNGDRTYFDWNNLRCCAFRFDIYADTNFWDSTYLDNERDLFLTLSLSSTDFYSDLKIMSWYSSLIYDTNQLIGFLNDSDNRDNLVSNATNYQSYTYSTDFYLQKQSYLEDTETPWNNAEYWYIILYYDTEDCYVDEAYINCTNKYDTPFYSSVLSTGYNNGYNIGYQNGLNANQQNIFDNAYDLGKQDGYNNGYNSGRQIGYNNGYNNGYDVGYDEGLLAEQTQIYNNGYDAGQQTGYNTGYDAGYINGYDVGHLDGIEDAESGEYSLSNMVVSVADTPINIFKSIFDVEFMGFNLVPILFGITALGIIIWLIRRFTGGN